MANTYNQIYIHLVFAVQGRISLIMPQWKEELYKYITGTIESHGHHLYAIGGMEDHIHILVSMSPAQSIQDLVRDTKRASTLWINGKHLVLGNFAWQKGYGAFSVSKSVVDKTIQYINNQYEHHHKKTFREEYIEFLKAYNIPYDERYIFEDAKNGDIE